LYTGSKVICDARKSSMMLLTISSAINLVESATKYHNLDHCDTNVDVSSEE